MASPSSLKASLSIQVQLQIDGIYVLPCIDGGNLASKEPSNKLKHEKLLNQLGDWSTLGLKIQYRENPSLSFSFLLLGFPDFFVWEPGGKHGKLIYIATRIHPLIPSAPN